MLTDESGYVSYKFKTKLSLFPGKKYGLHFYLYLGDYKVELLDFPMIDGIKLIVHNSSIDPGYYGGVSAGGINVPSGLFSEIKVNRMFSYKLPSPYNNCLKDVKSLNAFNSDLYRFIIQNTSYSYRQEDCFNYCFGREVTKNKTNESSTESIVHYETLSDLDLDSENVDSLINKCKLECPLECDSIKYDLAFSSTKFSNDFIRSLNISLTDIVYVNVYYECLAYTEINELVKTDVWDLIANIGGNLGLFIGFTFLNLVELIELIFEIFIILVQRKKLVKQNKVVSLELKT
jgi:hypothetical protein